MAAGERFRTLGAVRLVYVESGGSTWELPADVRGRMNLKSVIMSNEVGFTKRRALILGINGIIAAVHLLRLGSYLQEGSYHLYYSYFSDIILPFGFYFLLCESERKVPVLRHWGAKLAITFLTPSIAETFQHFGIPVLGSTFDLLDYFMYALGAISAVMVDRLVFFRIFDFWPREKTEL